MNSEAQQAFNILKDNFKRREEELEALPQDACVVVTDGSALRTSNGNVGVWGEKIYSACMADALDMARAWRKVAPDSTYPQVLTRASAMQYFGREHKRLLNSIEEANGLPLTS